MNRILAIYLYLFLIISIMSSCSNQDIERSLEKINSTSISERIKIISTDSTEGRAPGSRGSFKAQKYIADQMRKIGLQPGMNDSSYIQNFELIKIDINPLFAG